ncbi:hypothetical protein HPB48_012899 [Haemaphysalis longicornis]|uniref:CCHC-type domain-containing protein n=1 Tax=Haemaphysalis longicornis TaxID=44386 RepID=A0A9J6GJV1_HAELO|nr:hypothetical protein HPB48_012899 [Haemaphysalis longicornis]
MLGKSSAAVINFNGPHVPFNVTYQSGDYRCRPYRKTVQYCCYRGEVGHWEDVCPQAAQNVCLKMRPDQSTTSSALPAMLQSLQTTASGGRDRLQGEAESRTFLPPNVQQQCQVKNQEPRSGWRPRTEDFPDLQAFSSTYSNRSGNNV